MKEYLKLTANLRGNITRLFIPTTKPYKISSQDTLARWIKTALQSAGIDLSIFTPHSTRSAAISPAAAKIPMRTVLKVGNGGAWEQLLNITITTKILFLKKTFQIFWTRFALTFYLSDYQTKFYCHWLNLFCRSSLFHFNSLFHSRAHCLWRS